MTVVNYSVQDTFGNNQFFWNGVGWFQDLLDPGTDLGGRFLDALLRNLLFSALILLIEVPLGIAVALSMPREGWTVGALPRPDGAAAADPVERRRHDLAGLRPRRHRPARLYRQLRSASTTTTSPIRSPPGSPSSSWTSGTGRRSSRCSAMRASSRSPTPTTRPPRSTAPRAGRCSSRSSCRRCGACC